MKIKSFLFSVSFYLCRLRSQTFLSSVDFLEIIWLKKSTVKDQYVLSKDDKVSSESVICEVKLKNINCFKYFLPINVKAFIHSEIKNIVEIEISLNATDDNSPKLEDGCIKNTNVNENFIFCKKYIAFSSSSKVDSETSNSDAKNVTKEKTENQTDSVKVPSNIIVLQNVLINKSENVDSEYNIENYTNKDKRASFLEEIKYFKTQSKTVPEDHYNNDKTHTRFEANKNSNDSISNATSSKLLTAVNSKNNRKSKINRKNGFAQKVQI